MCGKQKKDRKYSLSQSPLHNCLFSILISPLFTLTNDVPVALSEVRISLCVAPVSYDNLMHQELLAHTFVFKYAWLFLKPPIDSRFRFHFIVTPSNCRVQQFFRLISHDTSFPPAIILMNFRWRYTPVSNISSSHYPLDLRSQSPSYSVAMDFEHLRIASILFLPQA